MLRSCRSLPLVGAMCAVLALTACDGGGGTIDGDSLAPLVDVALPDTAVELSAVLPALDVQLAKAGAVAGPPVSDAQLQSLTTALPCRLPPMLEQIYRWHDGVSPIIPGYNFLSLEQMVESYTGTLAMERKIGISPSEGWPPHYLPILKFDGQEYIALDCAAPDYGALRHNMNEYPAWDARHRGLGHFLNVTLSAYEGGAYRVREGYLDSSPLGVAQAYRRHAQPSELAALERNWQQIDQALTTAQGMAFSLALTWAQHFPDERYIATLVQRAAEADPQIASSAAFALGALLAQEAEPTLAKLLSHPSANVRNLAASSLSKLDRIEPLGTTVRQLIDLLRDDEELVRISAIEALATARSTTAVAPLVELLPRSRPGIQLYIVDTLGKLRDRAALDALHTLRSQVAAMQPTAERGGIRASDSPPQRLLAAIDEAIRKIGS